MDYFWIFYFFPRQLTNFIVPHQVTGAFFLIFHKMSLLPCRIPPERVTRVPGKEPGKNRGVQCPGRYKK